MIAVTVTIGNSHEDLWVPGDVTFARLRQLIQEGLAAKGILLPGGLSLSLADKILVVSDHDMVSSFGISDGDRLHIEAKGTGNDPD